MKTLSYILSYAFMLFSFLKKTLVFVVFPREPLSLFPLYFRDLVHVQGFSFIFWSWPLVS
ncbi:unnamed protein product, partial [Brassica napus]